MCEEPSEDLLSLGKPDAGAESDMEEIPTEVPLADPSTETQLQGNLLQEYEQQFERLVEERKLSKLCSDVGLMKVEIGHIFIKIEEDAEPDKMKNLCRGTTLHPEQKQTKVRG